ncbi:MAG: AAA family ATPase [Bacteroidales bacterium]|nr:AAA family ATPase [Bacteroidales bacterium]
MLTKGNISKLHQILKDYRQDFPSWWSQGRFKWEAVKVFKDNWNSDVPPSEVAEMFEKSLYGTEKLLTSESFPRENIITYAEIAPEKVISIMKYLFNEKHEYGLRVAEFKDRTDFLYKMHGGKSHLSRFNDEFSVASYFLWLRFPDNDYMYSYDVGNKVLEMLGVKDSFTKDYSESNIKLFTELYDEICKYIKEDFELVSLFESKLTKSCYPDPEYKTLTMDLGYYICEKYFAKEYDFSYIEETQSSEDTIEEDEDPETIEIFSDEDAAAKTFESMPESAEESAPSPDTEYAPYTKNDFLNDVFMAEKDYKDLVELLSVKKNVILQGVPGVGKTFASERLAYSVMGVKDESRVKLVQFHQNYSYEDFIMGYKPYGDGFRLVDGVFYRFCNIAKADPDNEYFFIIDEINRGNMSKIFGEMFMYIEKGYRGKNITLAYDDRPFCVPENLYIIGTMNTADRSLALIDFALRRRFSFFEFEPGFETKGFRQYQSEFKSNAFNNVIRQIISLNEEISSDASLGRGFRIGHSYFCDWTECTPRKLRIVIQYDILPMLEEYWFDNVETYTKWKNALYDALK